MSQRSAQKAESRAAIVRSAAKLLRERGLPGMSVERAMAGAGLTVGAFYAHFASKRDLLEHAFALALGDVEEMMKHSARGREGRAALKDATADYLSEAHRDHADIGCPLPAVSASALTTGDKPARQLLANGLLTLAGRTLALSAGEISEERALAIAVLMVGAQVLARATRGTPVSSALLAASRNAARDLLGK